MKEAVLSKDESIKNIKALTYAEYEALATKDPKTLYKITDMEGSGLPITSIPDVDKMETTNRITGGTWTGPTNGTYVFTSDEWVADRTGYVSVFLNMVAGSTTWSDTAFLRNGKRVKHSGANTALWGLADIFPVEKGDIIRMVHTAGLNEGDPREIYCYFVPAKYTEAVPPIITEYSVRDDISLGGYKLNFYVSPSGNDDNDGYHEESPMRNIHSLLHNIASDTRLPRSHEIWINIEVGDYTFPDDYEMPSFNRRVVLFGKGITEADIQNTVCYVHGVYAGFTIRDNFASYNLKWEGYVDNANGALLSLNAPSLSLIQNGYMVGANKDVDYYGIYANVGNLRIYGMGFNDLPRVLNCNSNYCMIQSIKATTANNDLFIRVNNALISCVELNASYATKLYELGNGGRIFFPGDSMYSTTEQITGELSIANKPIYRRTFNVTGPALNATSSQVLLSGGVDLVVRFEAVCMTNGADTIGAIYYSDAGNLQRSVSIYHNTVSQAIYCNITVGGNSLYATRPFAITVWYTKV
jgi:hypothetical protein